MYQIIFDHLMDLQRKGKKYKKNTKTPKKKKKEKHEKIYFFKLI